MKKKVTAIIAAGGSGKRMNSQTPKPFIKIKGKPLLMHALDVFETSKSIDDIVIVIAKNFIKKTISLIRKNKYKKVSKVVQGGSTRARSVYNGLSVVDDDCEIVAVHDAARPFVTQDIVARCVLTAQNDINCVAAVSAKDTIKIVDLEYKNIQATPDRKLLWLAQTPQVFNKKTLMNAYSRLGKKAWNFSDDASLIEAYGAKVKVVLGDYSNIKITTKEDLRVAETLFKK